MPKRKRADLPQVRQRQAAATYQRPRGYLTLWVSAFFNGSNLIGEWYGTHWQQCCVSERTD